jgi:hypothetical protein
MEVQKKELREWSLPKMKRMAKLEEVQLEKARK